MLPMTLFDFVALQKFRDMDDVSGDIEEMQIEFEEQKLQPEWSMKQLLTDKPHRLPLMLVSVLAVAQQLSGINMV